ncbi:MAG: zinc metallopeptidase [Deltaproteobacteria bacterium]|nr:zinc metallopeptidase [Deltaproteobacteria bacterium]
MIFDPLYWVVIGVGMALSLWANMQVKGSFRRYSQVRTHSGLTGKQIAERILADNGIRDVTIERVAGNMTDHYDPRSRVLRLSETVYDSDSMAAVGVAAHEVGHALQHAQGYAPLQFRSRWVPVANLGGGISMFVIIAAFFAGGMATAMGSSLAWAGILLFSTTTLFTLVTVPVELDASRRALASLSGRYLSDDEVAGARKVLNAAALTYVAAFVTSLLTLLYWAHALGLLGGRRD